MSFNDKVLHNEDMNPIYQVQQIINRYIALPLAIKVFKKDQVEFQKFKIGNLYLDLLDNCDRLKEMTQFLLDKMLHFFTDKDFPFLRKSVYDGPNDHTLTVCLWMIGAHEKCIYTNNYAH